MEHITHARLVSLLRYEPDTGLFYWRKSRGRGHKTTNILAGTKHSSGYIYIRHRPKNYTAHRLAWYYITGHWPQDQIDHINGDRTDNRFCNLRPATRTQNMRNIKRKRTNKSGLKGVSWSKECRKWRACIVAGGQSLHLGLFLSKEDAHAAYWAAAQKLHGDFARSG